MAIVGGIVTQRSLGEVKTLSCPRVIFPEGFDEQAAFETSLKGWLSAQVEVKRNSRNSF